MAVAKNFDTVVAVKAATSVLVIRLSACNAACSARAASQWLHPGKLPQGGTNRDPVPQGQQLFVCHAGTGIWRGITGISSAACTVRAMACGLKSVDERYLCGSGDKQ